VSASTKLFNTAIVSTKIPELPEFKDYSSKLSELLGSDAFQAILDSIELYAERNGISEEDAAEKVIKTFRAIDKVWDDYIFQEGLAALKTKLVSKNN